MKVYNIVTLLLTLVVLAVTALNSYTTQLNCDVYLSGVEYNNNELIRTRIIHNTQVLLAEKDAQAAKVVEVAQSEAQRADNLQGEFNGLAKQYVQLRHAFNDVRMDLYNYQQVLSAAGQHIVECHKLLEANGITPPELPDVQIQSPPMPEATPSPATPAKPENKTA